MTCPDCAKKDAEILEWQREAKRISQDMLKDYSEWKEIESSLATKTRELEEARNKLSNAKAFHRGMCEIGGMGHDETDWDRDLACLEEKIRGMLSALRKRVAEETETANRCAARAGAQEARADGLWKELQQCLGQRDSALSKLGQVEKVFNEMCDTLHAATEKYDDGRGLGLRVDEVVVRLLVGALARADAVCAEAARLRECLEDAVEALTALSVLTDCEDEQVRKMALELMKVANKGAEALSSSPSPDWLAGVKADIYDRIGEMRGERNMTITKLTDYCVKTARELRAKARGEGA